MVKINLKKIKKTLNKKSKFKRVLKKPKRITVKVGEYKPAQYISTFFKDEWEETKQNMFLK